MRNEPFSRIRNRSRIVGWVLQKTRVRYVKRGCEDNGGYPSAGLIRSHDEGWVLEGEGNTHLSPRLYLQRRRRQ